MNAVIESSVFPWCKVEFRTGDCSMDGYRLLTIDTGCAHLQTYATREELVSLANALLFEAQTMLEVA
jgi:hypothetical protein